MSIYSQIKEQVGTEDAARFYGYRIDRDGMMCCPFHDDRTPSMKVDKNFICFGCQEKGDVIRFASLLFGLTPYGAAKKLAADMRLTVSVEKRSNRKAGAAKRIRQKRAKGHQLEQVLKRISRAYCDYWHLINKWIRDYRPRSPDEDFHPLFVEAIQKRDYVRYLLDLLFYGSEEEKALIAIEKRKEVGALEKRITEIKAGDRKPAACGGGGYIAGDECGGSGRDAGSDREGPGEEQCDECGTDPFL